MKFLLITALFASTAAASAESKPSTKTHTQIFIGTGSEGIYSTWLNPKTGALTSPQPEAKVTGSGFIAIHPNKKFLYSTAQIDKQTAAVTSYSIESNGTLSELGKHQIPGKKLCHISLDATAKVLMGASYHGGSVISLPVKQDGSLGKPASFHQHEGQSVHPKRQTAPHAHSIYSGPANQFAYAPDLGIDKVMIYSLDPKTAKIETSGFAKSPDGAGPRHMKFSQNGKQAYVLNELTVDISVFDRDAKTGKLTSKQLISTLPEGADKTKMTCSEIRVSSNGQFVYCANRDVSGQGRDTLSVFSVDTNGKLTRIQTIAAEVIIPRNIHLDPSGQWLIVAGQKSNNVPVFKINASSGKLSYTEVSITVPAPMCIVFRK